MLKTLAQSDITPRPLIENMLQAVYTFVGSAEQSDDLTMLAIQFSKPRID